MLMFSLVSFTWKDERFSPRSRKPSLKLLEAEENNKVLEEVLEYRSKVLYFFPKWTFVVTVKDLFFAICHILFYYPYDINYWHVSKFLRIYWKIKTSRFKCLQYWILTPPVLVPSGVSIIADVAESIAETEPILINRIEIWDRLIGKKGKRTSLQRTNCYWHEYTSICRLEKDGGTQCVSQTTRVLILPFPGTKSKPEVWKYFGFYRKAASPLTT